MCGGEISRCFLPSRRHLVDLLSLWTRYGSRLHETYEQVEGFVNQ